MITNKIAVIGSGISGLTCGYILNQDYQVDIFEANDYIGGHTHTVMVDKLAIDTGFIVFNDRTYPNFRAMLDRLGVAYSPTEMSFSVRNDNWDLEYNGNSINSLFADRKNLIRPKFARLIYDIIKFNRLAKLIPSYSVETLGEFLIQHKFGKWFVDGYLLPMGSAIWSMGIKEMLNFPLAFFARFFDNHGLLDIANRPQWFTVSGGSANYISKLITPFKNNIYLNAPVSKIIRHAQSVELLFANGESRHYAQVICACHSDQALSLLDNPTAMEQQVLGAIKYSENEVVLHTDTSLLPRRKLAHASWNYLITNNSNQKSTLTYNMNILQGLDTKQTYCVTLNSSNLIDESKICQKFNYHHPVFSSAARLAQQQWQDISGVDRIHFCGAYWHNGFHEDGVNSAIRVCQQLGVNFAC
jgi:predicted NAD/FAD-binding protein